MKLQLLDKLGDGSFADVWRARDELDREVAVKIIREANVGVANALAHAKALARAKHPNVVAVLTLETVTDPTTDVEVNCVVMELIEGENLDDRFKRGKLSIHEVSSLATGIADGLEYIHSQGMAHGDLHSQNVMVTGSSAKIIDILYRNTLATLTTESRASRLKRDLLSLRLLIQELIANSELDAAEATEFNNMLEANAQIQDMRTALHAITTQDDPDRRVRALEYAYARLVDADFVDSEAYAAALAEETPDFAVVPLLKQVVQENVYDYKHRNYLLALWSRLNQHQRAEVLTSVSAILDRETPKGKWWPALRILSSLRTDGWKGLSKLVQLRLEGLITKDVLAGRYDIYGVKQLSGGGLGTYAISLWRNFAAPAALADNLITMLRQSWYTQNYVGRFFMLSIPAIAGATGKHEEFIKAFRYAVTNDARIVVNKLDELPPDWVAEIRAT
jgi:hypothetical protein